VTKDTNWQRFEAFCVPATGALAFGCLLSAVTVWFSKGALGPWFSFVGVGLALIAAMFATKAAQGLFVPLLLGVAGVGLALLSGGVGAASASAILWPILGAAAIGNGWTKGVGTSLAGLSVLAIFAALVRVPVSAETTAQSGILALSLCGALALAAWMQFRAQNSKISKPFIERLADATATRDLALVEARDARAENKGRAQFMAEMSHEIRTPLNAILGFADTMREGVFGPLPPAYNDYPELIHTSGTHLLDLVGDLLDLSKIEAGRYETSLKPIRLDELAYEGVRLSSGAARTAGVQLRHEASGAVEVRGDARAMRQIIFNLISNAIKFTPKDGRISLRVLVDAARGLASLEVQDSGVGINAIDLAKIGEPWNQATDTSTGDTKKSRGSGLGLALVKRLTDLQGGTFDIASTPEVGTRARISFPLAPEPTTSPNSPNSPTQPT
jgi:signal transduction histidine kinase